jgi:pimeloyl-ACP methyl ester carboxylesterase
MEGFKSRNYKGVVEAIEGKGYKVVFVPIQWKRTTIADWVAELGKVYEKYDPKDTILAGFSYGLYTAFVTATKRQPAELWLYSLSPYFTEDIPFIKQKWLDGIGKHRTEAFQIYSFDNLYPKITCPVKLLAGEKEMKKYPDIRRRFNDASQKFKHVTALEVPNAPHKIDHPNYIAAIKDSI